MEKELKCPHCNNDDKSLIFVVHVNQYRAQYHCDVCAKEFEVKNNERS